MMCAGYIRAARGINADREETAIRSYVKKRGWEISKMYYDGSALSDDINIPESKVFQKMKSDGMGRMFECIITQDISRMGPSVYVTVDLLRLIFFPAGIHMAILADGICSADMEAGDVDSYLLGKSSDFHKKRSNAAARENCEKRQYGKYGYRYVGNSMELETDDETAGTIREIYELFTDGKTMIDIVKLLNSRGTETPQDYIRRQEGRAELHDQWTVTKLRGILRNRMYTGRWERSAGGEKKIFPCPAIISREVFETAQKMSKPKRSGNKPYSTHAFMKKIVDRDTGWKLMLHMKNGIPVFRMDYPKPPEAEYEKMLISYDEVERQTRHLLLAESRKAEHILEILESEEGIAEKERRMRCSDSKMSDTFKEMLGVENCIMPLRTERECGGITQEEYVLLSGKCLSELRRLDGKLQAEIKERDAVETQFSSGNAWVSTFAHLEIPDRLDAAFMKRLVERVECEKFENVHLKVLHSESRDVFPEEWMENGNSEEDS